jgi:hypothetical protein
MINKPSAAEFLAKDSPEKLRVLLAALDAGETREAVAERLGYRSVKSLDSFLRRRGYVWDRHQQRYVEKPSTEKEGYATLLSPPIPDMVARVLTLFEAPGADAKTVAKQAGFSNHREMAAYMATHDYRWNADEKTYVCSSPPAPSTVTSSTAAAPLPTESAWQSYGTFLAWLSTRQDALQSLLSLSGDPQFLPRYLVPGVLVTKSIHMSHLLDQLARDYAREKHVTQREIFEVALTEFFQKHGYHDEIKRLFAK